MRALEHVAGRNVADLVVLRQRYDRAGAGLDAAILRRPSAVQVAPDSDTDASPVVTKATHDKNAKMSSML